MSASGMAEWFGTMSLYQQVFVVLFVVLVALPIATLIIFQFVESLRSLRSSSKARTRDGDDP